MMKYTKLQIKKLSSTLKVFQKRKLRLIISPIKYVDIKYHSMYVENKWFYLLFITITEMLIVSHLYVCS